MQVTETKTTNNNENMGGSLAKNTTIYAIGDIVPKLLAFISFPILTRYLSPEDYGILSYINTVNIFLSSLGFLCLNTYYLVYYFRVGSEEEKRKLLGNLTIFVIGFNIILLGFMFLFGSQVLHLLGSKIDFYPYMAIGVLTCFFNLFPILPSALFRVQERPLPLTILNILRGVIGLAITLYLVVVLDYKVLGVLYANLAVTIIFALIFFLITVRHVAWNINWTQIKFGLKFALPLLPGAISYQLTLMSDRIFIDKYVNLEALGIYSVAATLAMILNIISYASYKAFEPYFFKVYGTDIFLKKFAQVRDQFFFVIMVGAVGLSMFSKEFFELFSSTSYVESYFYVPLIMVGLVFSSQSLMYVTIVTARNQTKINSAITITSGVISVALNNILLPHIGVLGACISSMIAMGFILFAGMYFSRVRISQGRVVLSFVISVFVIYTTVYVLEFQNIWISIFIKSIFYVSLLAILIFVLKLKFRKIKM